MKVIDDFLPDAAAVREQAIAADYVDYRAHDGEVYRRVWIGKVPGLIAAVEDAMGPVDMLGMGYRLNYAGEKPNSLIHSDLGWGTHAAVIYLADNPDSGTAFWRHRMTGRQRIDSDDYGLFDEIKADWNTQEAWDRTHFVPMAMNRAVIYESAMFHSRYPFEAFGSTPQDGRLIAVAFFNVKRKAA